MANSFEMIYVVESSVNKCNEKKTHEFDIIYIDWSKVFQQREIIAQFHSKR